MGSEAMTTGSSRWRTRIGKQVHEAHPDREKVYSPFRIATCGMMRLAAEVKRTEDATTCRSCLGMGWRA